jgi:hypothetical protein
MATNVNTDQLDWAPLDRVFNAATAYGQRLIVSLTDQTGGCGYGPWQGLSWYQGGFEQVSNPTGLTPLSYWDYLQAIVNRYKDSPALGMWEPVNEPEASDCPAPYSGSGCYGHLVCPNEAAAGQALRYFFDTVGGEIHTLDPGSLVEDGFIASGQCGEAASYMNVASSPGIDVLSYHDYYDPTATIGGDQWNGEAVRFQQAASLDKPIIGGEEGIDAGTGAGCLSDQQRSTDFQAKIEAQMAAGSSGVLLWNWMPSVTGTCVYDIAPGDPALSMIAGLARDN